MSDQDDDTDDTDGMMQEGMTIVRASGAEAANCFGRFLNAPENEPAFDFLLKAQAVRAHPGDPGADRQIWMNEGRRALAAELLGFMVPREE